MTQKMKAIIGNIISAVAEIVTAVITLAVGAEPPAVAVAVVVVGAICQALGIQFLAPAPIASKKDAISNIVSGAAEAAVAFATLKVGAEPAWMVMAVVVVGAVCQALGVKFIPPTPIVEEE